MGGLEYSGEHVYVLSLKAPAATPKWSRARSRVGLAAPLWARSDRMPAGAQAAVLRPRARGVGRLHMT